jgi:diacylglycerol kinase family enzyme
MAVLSLACLLGVAVLFVIGVGGQVWRLVAVAAGLAVAVVGAWFVVSRRGAPRWTGAILAAIGLVMAVAASIGGEHHGLFVIAAAVLVVCSAATARAALPSVGSTRVYAVETERPEHPVLIMNPKSGGGKAERFRLVAECEARGIEPVVLRMGDDLLQLAEDAIARGCDVIGMAGGDGSQALVATVASKHGIPHVCVPAGTRNHFALDLGLDRDDVVGSLDAFTDGLERRVDLARVNGRVFVNNASMGVYAKIVQSDAYRAEKAKTTVDMLPEMLGPGAEAFDLRFEGADGRAWPSAHLAMVSNNPYELDHLAGRGTRERMDTGTLGVVAARIEGAQAAVSFAAAEAAGRIRSFSGWMEWSTPSFRIDSASPVEIGIDGEALKMDPPLVFESLPGALRVRVPRHAPGISPAARSVHMTGATVRDLLRVAAGR